jgi:hypothetical protein
MQQVAAGNDAWNKVSRHLGLPLYREEDVRADFDHEDIGPRTPTPLRRRPRIPRIDNISKRSWRDTSSSIGSMDSFSIAKTRGSRVTNLESQKSTQCSAAQAFDAIPEDSESLPPQKNEYHEVVSPLRQDNLVHALYCLTGLASSDSGSRRSQDSTQADPQTTRSPSITARRQGKPDWQGDLTSGTTQVSLGLVSATGEVDGLGDHDAGYNSGNFITDVQSKQILQHETMKEPRRRFFRF